METTSARCRQCGCTEANACLVQDDELSLVGGEVQPCWWVKRPGADGLGLCSGCAYKITVREPVARDGTV